VGTFEKGKMDGGLEPGGWGQGMTTESS
jgi:hypothetical protein